MCQQQAATACKCAQPRARRGLTAGRAQEKYNTRVAKLYKEKIATEAAGRSVRRSKPRASCSLLRLAHARADCKLLRSLPKPSA